jgi:hypothetical protein
LERCTAYASPFAVLNVPGIWESYIPINLERYYLNFYEENNSIYILDPVTDLQLTTDPLPQAAADIFAQWNEVQYSVPNAMIPASYATVTWGDSNPKTFPGVKTENGTKGITKISDLKENFAMATPILSESDDFEIGAMYWNDQVYNSAVSTARVKGQCACCSGKCGPVAVQPVNGEGNLSVYPNPANGILYVGGPGKADITIYNLVGRTLISVKNVSSVNVSGLAGGIYAVVLKDGSNVSTQKVVVLK